MQRANTIHYALLKHRLSFALPKARILSHLSNPFSTTTAPPFTPTESPIGSASTPSAIHALNSAVQRYPLTTSFIWLYANPLYCGAVFTALTIAGVSFPVELGAAFLLNSAMRRLRIPVILLGAAAACRVAPTLSSVPLSKMVTTPVLLLAGDLAAAETNALASEGRPAAANIGRKVSSEREQSHYSNTDDMHGEPPRIQPGRIAASFGENLLQSPTAYSTSPLGHVAGTPASLFQKLRGAASSVILSLHPTKGSIGSLGTGMLDKYGLGYSIAARAVSSVNLLALFLLIRYGVDLQPLLTWIGGGGGSGAESLFSSLVPRWAASCLLVNAAFYPLLIRHGIAAPAHALGEWSEPRIRLWANEVAEALQPLRRMLHDERSGGSAAADKMPAI